ncbi:MAG: hypothetical protein JST54_06030 [Deltaproteobacteria bacterium]|nr:hypothetical protein [Deltaproteobacteria bacterium]
MSVRPRLAALLVTLSACVTAPLTQERYQALSPESKALFDKYHQFMTDEREEAFLGAPNDAERRKIVEDMHVEERLAEFPKFVQEAIWSRTPVVGMDKNALFLAVGKPDAVDRQNVDPDTHELPKEVWRYRRGPALEHDYIITVVNDHVIDVQAPQFK